MTTFSTYKPSNKCNIVGLLVLFIVIAIGGFAIYWIYEFIESILPLIYLNILFSLLASFAIGYLGGFIIRKFKIRAPMVAIIIAIAALLLANVLRWANYCSRDFKKHFRDPLEDATMNSADLGLDGIDPNSVSAKQYATFTKLLGERLDSFLMDESQSSYGEAIIDRDASVEGIKKLFGNSFSDLLENLKGCNNAYEFCTRFLGLTEPTTIDLTLHPGKLLDYIKMVNDQGRWNIKSHRYSWNDKSDSEPVRGFMLWMVWLGELVALVAPAISVIVTKATYPYIESEDDWAVEEKGAPNFLFEDPHGGQANSYGMVKSDIMRNPEYIFSMNHISVIGRIPDIYYKVTYLRSKYFDENYVTVTYSALVNARKNQRKNVDIIKYMRVDANFIATLYGIFEQPVPVMCRGENRAGDVKAQNEAREDAMANGRPLSPQRPKATGAEAIFDQPTIYNQVKQQTNQNQYTAPSYTQPAYDPHSLQPVEPVKTDGLTLPEEPSFAQQELEHEKKATNNHGDMDGLDTSNLDLDNFDFSKMK